MVRTAYALRPDGINWPLHEDGRPSFRLEQLTVANGISHSAAHDALSDVRATIALARLIRQQQPKLFEFCLALHKKERVCAEIGWPLQKPFLHVSGMFAAERGCIAPMWPLAAHPGNKNEIIAWDLAFDPAQLATLDAAAIRQRMFSKAEDLPEGMTRLPIKTIHLNKSPVVIGNLKTLSSQMAGRWNIDLDAARQHAAAAAALPDLSGIWRAVFQRPEAETVIDVDEDLYGGFVGNEDRRTLNRLRALDPMQLASAQTGFGDARLEDLLWRYRARNFPHTLSPQEAESWEAYRAARLFDGAAGARTIDALFGAIDKLSETADERGEEVLGALYDYAEMIAPVRR